MLIWIFLGVHFVALIISFPLILKLTGYVKSHQCPKCNGKLETVKKRPIDKVLHIATFFLLPIKRCKCEECAWMGLRW